MNTLFRLVQVLAVVLILSVAVMAQTHVASQPATQAASQPATLPSPSTPGDKLSVTEGEVTVEGQPLRYRATAGCIEMRDEAGKAKADFFFVAYEKLDRTDPATRPITFVFNGGPGAAAVWLHLGVAGPKRIDFTDEGLPVGPPYRLVDNPHSWLDLTDLVFIDPVGTGYSRPAAGEKTKQFYGVQQDISSVADFIRLYTTRYQRWLSPKFLAGESYGTTRAAGLSEYLLDHDGMALNGIIFMSSVLDFQTLLAGDNNDAPYVMYVPSYAAVAWYHKRLAPDQQADLKATLAEVQQWAQNDYRTALATGDALSADQRQAIAQRLSRYTGLSVESIRRSNLRIAPGMFEQQLLADQRLTVGRFDGRLTGFNADPESPHPQYDPSFPRYLAAYTATFGDYVRRTLKYDSDLPYEVLTGRVQPWDLGRGGEGYLYVGDNLRSAMIENPRLHVMFASGYFDLATPYLATDYTINHLDLGAELAGHITRTYYMAGHMMYHNKPDWLKLKADVSAFIRAAQ